MKTLTIEDEIKLVNSVSEYLASGVKENAVEACCIWLWKAGRDRFNLSDDECSELVITYLKDPEYPIKYFKENNYPHFPSFFYSYTRNMVSNLRRLKRREYSDRYISLWDEEESKKKELLNELKGDMEEGLSGLKEQERILLKLRMNLRLEKNDWVKIKEYMGDNPEKIENFTVIYKARQEKIQKEKENLLVRMNHYNRKIFEHGVPTFSDSKKKLFKRLNNLNRIFTYKELGDLVCLQAAEVATVCKKAVNSIRESIDEKRVA